MFHKLYEYGNLGNSENQMDNALFIFLLPKLAYMKIVLYLYWCTQNILSVMESLYVVL